MPESTRTDLASAPSGSKVVLTACAMAVAAYVVFILPAALWRPVFETPEARIAQVAREMIQTGDWIVPTLGGEPRLIKPPLPYWLTAIAATALGATPQNTPQRIMTQAMEVPPALFAALAVFVVVLYGTWAFGRASGIMAGMVLGLSAMVMNYAWLGYCDITLMSACALTFCAAGWLLCTQKSGVLNALLLGFAMGFGFMAKWFIPLIVLFPLIVEVAIRQRFDTRKAALFALSILVMGAVIAPWFYLVEQKLPGAMKMISGGINKSTAPLSHIPDHRWVYYFERLASGFLPWTPVMIIAWPAYLWTRKGQQSQAGDPAETDNELIASAHLRFFTISFIVEFFIFYATSKQQPYYLLPLFPPLALATGGILGRLNHPGGIGEEFVGLSQLAVGILGGLCIATLPFWPLKQLNTVSVETVILKDVPLMFLVGVAFALVHVFSARQWVEGKPLNALLAVAIFTYGGWIAWEFRWTAKAQARSLYVESERLKSEISSHGKGVRVYGFGPSQPLLVFFMEQPVKTLRNLIDEPEGQTGTNAPRRILVADRDELAKLKIKELPATSQTEFLVVEFPPDEDWPKRLKSVFKQLQEPPDE